jgi:NDP-sugar pyrophosphorylase family protein
MRLRAVVLAAGLGTRLRPLTAGVPKPLLPVLGRPLIAWTLERLAAVGVEATAINLHHRGDAISGALGDHFDGMPLHYSREETILGTLGALHPLREFVAPADLVILVNGDSLCRWPLEELIARHRSGRVGDDGSPPLATLLLSGTADPRAFGGGVAIDGSGRVITLLPRGDGRTDDPTTTRRVFMGAHVFATSLALEAPAAFSDIVRDLYEPRLAQGARIGALVSSAPWHDIGTPSRYLEAVLAWAGLEDAAFPANGWIVEPGATLEEDVMARASLILGGAIVGRSSHLDRAVIGPDVVLPAGARVADALVTPRSWGVVDGSREEGDLVFTPLVLTAGARG